MRYVPNGRLQMTATEVRLLADRVLGDELVVKQIEDKVRMDLTSGSTATVTNALYRVRAAERELAATALQEEILAFQDIQPLTPSWVWPVFELDFDFQTPPGVKEARGALGWLQRNATRLRAEAAAPALPSHRSKGKRH